MRLLPPTPTLGPAIDTSQGAEAAEETAEEPEPTPVPEPTAAPVPPPAVPIPQPTARPPVKIYTGKEPLPTLPADWFSSSSQPRPIPAGRPYPTYSYTVSIDSVVPQDGTVVTPRIGGLLAAVTVLKDDNYTLAEKPSLSMSYAGKKVIFSIGGCQASLTPTWQSARVDLSATSP